MLPNGGAAPEKPPPQIKQEGKFYSRMLSKESSSSLASTCPSFRVYYGVAAAGTVPFLWESRPGTPKHAISISDLPPLTPPPSYYYTTKNNSSHKSTKSNLFHTVLSLGRRCRRRSPSSSISLSSSSMSSSFTSVSWNHRRRPVSPRSSFSSMGEEDEEEESDDGPPTSLLCFKMRQRAAFRR
ncbi:hypothetical protein Cni_G23563 [Canna indica]|uniref:Uncharacterized protein n=1 Tax=Canna indica TaxID=4628 RepID=A0AAQ3KWC9_9LILI|nr:hypothetical protein Cni_G23563 [Canna indica]